MLAVADDAALGLINLGGPEILVVSFGALELLFFFVKVWALVKAFGYPAWAWEEAGSARGLWIVLLVVAFFLPLLGFVIALWFLFSTSVKISRMVAVGRRPGFPQA